MEPEDSFEVKNILEIQLADDSNYEVVRKIGSGAFGEVYEAIDLSTSKTPPSRVAIKIIPKTNLNTHTRRQRIAREVILHSRFRSHPSILRLQSYFEDSSRVYIVTELCVNGNLLRYLDCHPDGLPEDQVRGLMHDIVDGVQHLHSQGIMHRDLKLSNILLDNNMRTKIADFGLARVIDDSKSEDEFTFCGTPNYISPEILTKKPYGLASDIWSLGCIFLTLLTGTPPFAGAEIEDVLNRVIRGKYDIPRRISRDARALVHAMLERNPGYRISTFEILKDIFFEGQISALRRVPPNFFALADESATDDDSQNQDRVPPRAGAVSRTRHSRGRRPKMTSHQDQSGNEEDKGLRTMLEEMRMPSNQQPRGSKERASNPYRGGQGSENCEPTRHRTHIASRRGLDLKRGSTRSDSSRQVSGGSTSRDSYSAKKEATFELYENDDEGKFSRGRKNGPLPELLGKPSPGEGLRNALGNLENRLHRKPSVGRTNLSHDQGLKRGQKTSSEKGFVTLVEELVQPCRSRKENVDPASNRRSSADLQRGLLSLLSNLNKPSKPENPRERHISPIPCSSRQEHSSYSPILPSRQPLRSHLSEHATFAMKYQFTTAGIPPLTQRTKHGVVKIDRNGYIELHLPSVSRNTFSISPDSTRITVTDSGRSVWKGDVDSLPWRWTRVYRYASRFVGVCLAKIPKISLEIDGIRSRVMLNGDFEACNTREGILIRRGAKQRVVKAFAMNEEGVERLEWEGDISEIPDKWEDLFRSSVKLYSRCIVLTNDVLPEGGREDTAKFVSGVGWCTTRGPMVQLLFKDAVRIDVNLEKRELMYCNANRRKEKWPLYYDRLPTYITERLDQCRAFADAE